MTEKDAPRNFVLAIDPMLANIDEITEDKYELVFIYGYLGKVTGETVRLYQGLDLRRILRDSVARNCPRSDYLLHRRLYVEARTFLDDPHRLREWKCEGNTARVGPRGGCRVVQRQRSKTRRRLKVSGWLCL